MSKPLVSDELWEAIEPLVPVEPPKPKGGRPRVPDRATLTGIGYSTAFDLLRRPWRISRLDLGTLERVCQFYGCEPAELLVYDPSAPVRARSKPARNPLQNGADWIGGYLGLDDDEA